MRSIVSSLGAFAAAGLRPRTALAKAIMLVLLIKLVAVTVVKIYMVTDGANSHVDAAAMAQALGVSPRKQ